MTAPYAPKARAEFVETGRLRPILLNPAGDSDIDSLSFPVFPSKHLVASIAGFKLSRPKHLRGLPRAQPFSRNIFGTECGNSMEFIFLFSESLLGRPDIRQRIQVDRALDWRVPFLRPPAFGLT